MTRQALDELKQQIPLLDYLRAQDWSATRRLSGGRWMGLCPLHRDRKPSFMVDASKGLFYCYGCGRGGEVIRFAELYHEVRFPQALALLRQWLETTRARTICCCSPSLYLKQVREAQSVVASGSVTYSSITATPHELFDQTGCHPGIHAGLDRRLSMAMKSGKAEKVVPHPATKPMIGVSSICADFKKKSG